MGFVYKCTLPITRQHKNFYFLGTPNMKKIVLFILFLIIFRAFCSPLNRNFKIVKIIGDDQSDLIFSSKEDANSLIASLKKKSVTTKTTTQIITIMMVLIDKLTPFFFLNFGILF